MKKFQKRIRDILSLESEDLYSPGFALLFMGSILSNLVLYLFIIFAFLEPLSAYGMVFVLPVYILYPAFAIASVFFLVFGAKKYGIVIAALPLLLHIVFAAILAFSIWVHFATRPT